MEEELVLCVSNAYEQKFYLDKAFGNIPQGIKDELKIMCVLFTEDVGGVLKLYFNSDGELELETSSAEGDFAFDEIGAELKVKKMRNEKRELFESLEMFYKVFYLGLPAEEE